MTLGQILLALRLVALNGPDHQVILINPESVVELREPRGQPGQHFHESVHCLVFTSRSTFTAVLETCREVRQKLEAVNGG